MAGEKFSRNIHFEQGGLHGWCSHCGAVSRHEALEKTVKADSYATTVRRLNVLANLDENQNPMTARVARADEKWLHAKYRGKE